MNIPHVQGARMVTALNGELVWTDSEEWRLETEARMLLHKYPPRARDELLALIEAERSPEAFARLKDAMRAVMLAGAE